MIQLPSFTALARLLTDDNQMSTLLPQLHDQAIRTVGGTSSMLLQINPRTGLMHPTSGHGVDPLPTEPWALAAAETRSAEEAMSTGESVLVGDLARRLPGLSRTLGAASALFVPLVQIQEPMGVLVVGLPETQVAPTVIERINWVGYAFVLAIERSRLRRDAEMQREIRTLLDGFSRVASSALNLTTALEVLCRDAAQLFGAERASVWLHDRRARDLVLAGSSDPSHAERGTRVPADSVLSAAAVAMRRERAEIREPDAEVSHGATNLTSTITVPLRGRRRALGTLVFDAVRIDPGGELDVLDDADELGHQLSGAIENIQLLEEVLRSRRELESTFNSIPDLVAVCDTRLRIVQMNQAFSERLGVTREQASGRPLGDFIGFEATAWIAKLDLWGTGGSTQTFSREMDDAVLNGRHAVTVSTLMGPDGDPVGAVVVARDVSRQAKLEAERAALRDKLTEAEKLAVLGQFVAGIAHELNNPLQSVLGHVELLRRNADVSKEIKQDLQVVFRDADRAAKVVRDLLIFAGRRDHALRPTSLNAVVTKVLSSRSRACRAAGIDVVRDLDDSLPRLHGDPLRLRQAILNVFMNAEQAVAQGGRIEVRTRYWPTRSVVVLEVHDSGPGIAPDVLPRIFEPFFTTKDVGQGTGLGLTITYGVVQDHAGQVLATNHQAGGTVFTIELPIRAPEPSAAAE